MNRLLRPAPDPLAPSADTLSGRTAAAIDDVLAGRRRRGSPLLFAGPAVIASIAYVDPGNFATNIEAGSRFGYGLLWVVVMANLIAMLFQALSAKLGIVTGRNLAEMCRDRLPRAAVWPMWIVSEIGAMATDLAEFLGGAIGLSLLFDLPLMTGMFITAIVTYGILLLEGRGFRPIELVIGALVAAIALCYVAEMFIVPVDWAAVAIGAVTPSLPDAAALAISVGIIGATVMPHAVYLHSGLTQARGATSRDTDQKRTLLRYSNREVVIALAAAGLVNMAMVILAAGAFHAGNPDVASIESAYQLLTPLLGGAAAAFFLTSLVVSGISSSVVGTMAGQMIMQGFVNFHIPIWVRRLITMAPAFVVVAMGVDTTRALVLSQVVLSFVLPIPMIALVIFTQRRDVMGEFVNGLIVTIAAIAATVVVLGLNFVLLAQVFGIPVPGLAAS